LLHLSVPPNTIIWTRQDGHPARSRVPSGRPALFTGAIGSNAAIRRLSAGGNELRTLGPSRWRRSILGREKRLEVDQDGSQKTPSLFARDQRFESSFLQRGVLAN